MESLPLSLGACGSTVRTVQCLEALHQNGNFSIRWVITPPPKPVGRKQTLTPSPVEVWANTHGVEVRHVTAKLSELKDHLLTDAENHPIDLLLVVDFGYIIPQWLLDLPTIAPVNVHPSDLPKYRGSSPAQFALLAGETETAVCIMRLEWELDAGPIIARLPFTISNTMTQAQYYETAFALASAALPRVLLQYAQDRQETPQPVDSPTPIASRLTREDGALGNIVLHAETITTESGDPLDPILLDRKIRALTPWPGVWGIVAHYKGRDNVRLKILSGQLSVDKTKYTVSSWQYDGEPVKTVASF